jgi:hypothetical protein
LFEAKLYVLVRSFIIADMVCVCLVISCALGSTISTPILFLLSPSAVPHRHRAEPVGMRRTLALGLFHPAPPPRVVSAGRPALLVPLSLFLSLCACVALPPPRDRVRTTTLKGSSFIACYCPNQVSVREDPLVLAQLSAAEARRDPASHHRAAGEAQGTHRAHHIA